MNTESPLRFQAIDHIWECFYRLCVDCNLFHMYQYIENGSEPIPCPNISPLDIFLFLNDAFAEHLNALKNALNALNEII